jgi:hypothetical protein
LLEAGGFRVEHGIAAKNFLIGLVRDLGHAEEDVEVIRHDGVGENLNAAVIRDLPQLFGEGLLGDVIEQKGAIHRACHDVVDGIALRCRNFNASNTHGRREREKCYRSDYQAGGNETAF